MSQKRRRVFAGIGDGGVIAEPYNTPEMCMLREHELTQSLVSGQITQEEFGAARAGGFQLPYTGAAAKFNNIE